MSTLELLAAIAVAWSGVGLVVAILLGRLFRAAGTAPEEAPNRLICRTRDRIPHRPSAPGTD